MNGRPFSHLAFLELKRAASTVTVALKVASGSPMRSSPAWMVSVACTGAAPVDRGSGFRRRRQPTRSWRWGPRRHKPDGPSDSLEPHRLSKHMREHRP